MYSQARVDRTGLDWAGHRHLLSMVPVREWAPTSVGEAVGSKLAWVQGLKLGLFNFGLGAQGEGCKGAWRSAV